MGWEAKGWTETHTGKIRVDRNLEHFLCTKHCSKSSLCVSSCEPHKDPMKEDDYYSHLKDEGTEAREAIWWRLQTWKEGANYLPTATSSRISPSLPEVGLCAPPLITDFLWGMQQQGLGGDRKAGSREEGTSLLFLSCSCWWSPAVAPDSSHQVSGAPQNQPLGDQQQPGGTLNSEVWAPDLLNSRFW